MHDPGVLAVLLIVIVGVVYFLPAIIASNRRHRNRTSIGLLNLFLGWTLLGWVAALVWACTGDVEKGSEDTEQISIVRQHDILTGKVLAERSVTPGLLELIAERSQMHLSPTDVIANLRNGERVYTADSYFLRR